MIYWRCNLEQTILTTCQAQRRHLQDSLSTNSDIQFVYLDQTHDVSTLQYSALTYLNNQQ